MKVKISWRKCVTNSVGESMKLYLNSENCPLGQTLKEMRIPFLWVGGTHIICGEYDQPETYRTYHFDVTNWNMSVMERAARGHRAVVLDIPGLEREGRYGCND